MKADFSPWHIAVIEDDHGLRSAILRMLTACGWKSTGYVSAEDFLNALSPTDIDCLVLDLYLPGISGFELFDRMMERNQHLPTIFITAQDDDDIRVRIQDLGERYLPKPFTGNALAEKVRKCIESVEPP